MDCVNFLIVGSGPAGVAAARRLEGRGACIVDVGDLPDSRFTFSSLNKALDQGAPEELLGGQFETLANLVYPNRMHSKLRASALRFVARGVPFEIFGGAEDILWRSAGSYAAGGFSNAWGAQLLRYTEDDIADVGGWPIDLETLSFYYRDLEEHIGIAGQKDDMFEFLGEASSLLPPAPIVPAAEFLLTRYLAEKARGRSKRISIGRSRLAVLTQPYAGREAHNFGETEFFSTEQQGIYTARRTLDSLLAQDRIGYLPRHRLEGFDERSEYVEVHLFCYDDGTVKTVRARNLLLACGTLQTARIVLLSKKEPRRSLPFIDHPPTLLPVFFPRMFGSALPSQSFPVQLVATLEGKRDMISFYYPGGLLWSDLIPEIPLPLDASIRLMGNLLGGMLVAQIWQSSRPTARNRLSLFGDQAIRIDYPDVDPYPHLKYLISALRHLGGLTLQRFANISPPGCGFHYAACLPMSQNPGPFETHVDGRLWDSKRVRVVDGSVLPSLPAKNHSLTMMANAARIADEAIECGY